MKNLCSLYIHVIRPKRRNNNNFFLHLNNQTSLYCFLYLNMRRTNEVSCLKVFGGYHKLSHFNSRVFILDFTWNCCRQQEGKKFREPMSILACSGKIRYDVSIAARTLLKILYFSGATTFSKHHRGWSLFMTGVENLFIYWPGRHNLGPRRQFQQLYWPGKSPGCIFLGHLNRVLKSLGW